MDAYSERRIFRIPPFAEMRVPGRRSSFPNPIGSYGVPQSFGLTLLSS